VDLSIEVNSIEWSSQRRHVSCSNDRIPSTARNGQQRTVGDILREMPIYKEFLLVNENDQLLSNAKQSNVSSIKSFHCDRLHLQLMCEHDRYEERLFELANRRRTTDESNTDDCPTNLNENECTYQQVHTSLSRRGLNVYLSNSIIDLKIRAQTDHKSMSNNGDASAYCRVIPTTTTSIGIVDRQLTAEIIDEDDADRYQLAALSENDVDLLDYSSDDEYQVQLSRSPYRPFDDDNEHDDDEF
jgi:hypothetical protein